MSRKGASSKTGRKAGGKFGAKKRITKTKINTKIGVNTKINAEEKQGEANKIQRSNEVVGVKFEILNHFEDNIFKSELAGNRDAKIEIKTVKKFRIPIPTSFFGSIKMNEIKKSFEITNI